MSRIKAPVVITANDLLSGEVVYLDAAHCGSIELSAAKVFEVADEATNELDVMAKEADVVGAYLAEVTVGASVTPRHYREGFRQRGPSNYFHGKQTAKGAEVAA
jgi:hypothetical protein